MVVATVACVGEVEDPVPCPKEPEKRGTTTKYMPAITMVIMTAAAMMKVFFGIPRGFGESRIAGNCGGPVSCACVIEWGRIDGGAGGEGGGGSSATGAPQYLQNF
jgi:hypothetical protein